MIRLCDVVVVVVVVVVVHSEKTLVVVQFIAKIINFIYIINESISFSVSNAVRDSCKKEEARYCLDQKA